tara:strand:+ start:127 stop:507 length:381 start_codon:yes stop_codon:yes gene_type:complete
MIYKALKSLGAKNFVIDGDVSTEEEFTQQVEFVSGKDENHNAIYERDVTKWPVTWAQVSAAIDTVTAQEPMVILREQRDILLAETDWWGASDKTMTDAQTAYRQALRDLPANTPDANNITWPTLGD